jgi:hypothetical protein
MRVLAAIIYVSVIAYVLYATGRFWGYRRQLRDEPANRKTGLLRDILLVVGLFALLDAAWYLLFSITSN